MKYLIQQVLMVQYICLIQYILFNFFWYDLDKSGNKIGHEIMQQNASKRTKVRVVWQLVMHIEMKKWTLSSELTNLCQS